jgi:hypothetical protein
LFELLLLSKQAGFSFRILPGSHRAARFAEVTRTFTTPEFLCRGNLRPERFALPFELQQLSPPAGFEPEPQAKSRCVTGTAPAPQACTTPQFQNVFLYLLTSLRLHFRRPRTPVASSRQLRFNSPKETRRKIPGGTHAHGLWDSNPQPCGLFQ